MNHFSIEFESRWENLAKLNELVFVLFDHKNQMRDKSGCKDSRELLGFRLRKNSNEFT